jgi:hypothetical protein
MIIGYPLTTVTFTIPFGDIVLDNFTMFSFYKPETEFINDVIAFQFCLVDLIDQDLPNALLHLPTCGEYIFKIMTGPDGVNYTEVYVDLFRLVCEEIIYNYPI